MTEFDPILSSEAALSTYFYLSMLAYLGIGAFVSWARSAPERRERARRARLVRVTGR